MTFVGVVGLTVLVRRGSYVDVAVQYRCHVMPPYVTAPWCHTPVVTTVVAGDGMVRALSLRRPIDTLFEVGCERVARSLSIPKK